MKQIHRLTASLNKITKTVKAAEVALENYIQKHRRESFYES